MNSSEFCSLCVHWDQLCKSIGRSFIHMFAAVCYTCFDRSANFQCLVLCLSSFCWKCFVLQHSSITFRENSIINRKKTHKSLAEANRQTKRNTNPNPKTQNPNPNRPTSPSPKNHTTQTTHVLLVEFCPGWKMWNASRHPRVHSRRLKLMVQHLGHCLLLAFCRIDRMDLIMTWSMLSFFDVSRLCFLMRELFPWVFFQSVFGCFIESSLQKVRHHFQSLRPREIKTKQTRACFFQCHFWIKIALPRKPISHMKQMHMDWWWLVVRDTSPTF